MGIFKKAINMIKAEANDLMDKIEDPVKLITQNILDLEQEYEKASKAVTVVLADVNAIKKRYDNKLREIDDCQEKARTLAKAGETELAKQVLMKRDQLNEEAQQIKVQLDNQQAVADKHVATLKQFQDAIDDAKRKKADLIARANSAKAAEKINKSIGDLNNSDAMNDFNRMAQKIEAMENKAQASADLNNSMADPVEAKLRELEQNKFSSKNYDDELNDLLNS